MVIPYELARFDTLKFGEVIPHDGFFFYRLGLLE